MGLLISSNDVALVYIQLWNEDWERLDPEVDSDQDGMNDAWEEMYGLNRTRRSVVGQSYDEGMYDADGDGLTNEAELLHGGDPLNPDTDGDCITDGIEVVWAQASLLDDSMTDVTPNDALTMADADGDGENDADALGCDLGGIVIVIPGDNNSNSTVTSMDTDNDGILNAEDDCPDTEEGAFVDSNGCSSTQRAALIEDKAENTSGDAAQTFFFAIMIGALLLSGGAYVILQNKRNDSEDVKDSITAESFAMAQIMPEENAPEWESPVLDASGPTITSEMLALVPGWNQDMVREYLLQGWTMDQLSEYYQEQVVEHNK
jgi:hypothetical protein